MRWTKPAILLVGATFLASAGGCATLRVTDPPRTATEQFLLSVALSSAIEQLSPEALRDRKVFVDSAYLIGSPAASAEALFLLGELRHKLLLGGVRLVEKRDEAQIVMEVRSGGIGIDRLEFLLGIPAIYIPTFATSTVPLTTPELAIIKNTRQNGYASVAFVAYWTDSGEIVAWSGPHIGRTAREDWWFFGSGPKTEGNIPPTERR